MGRALIHRYRFGSICLLGVTVSSYVPNTYGWSQSVIGSDGKYYTAGSNTDGIVGDGTTNDALSPAEFRIPGRCYRDKSNHERFGHRAWL